MLQKIREWSQGIAAWILVLLICASFALWGIHSYIEGNSGSQTVATVNGTDISQRQLQMAFERLVRQQEVKSGSSFVLNPEMEKKLKQQALQEILMNQILTQNALKQGYRFNVEETEAALKSNPTFQVKGQFSPVRFREVLNYLGFSIPEFLMNLQNAMLINQPRVGFIETAFALPNEVTEAIELSNQKRDITFLKISRDHFYDQIKLSSDDIKNYYLQHEDNYRTPESVSIDYIELSLPEIKKQIHVDRQQIKQYYVDNINQFVKPQLDPNKKTEVQPFEKVKNQVEQSIIQQKAEESFADLSEKLANLAYSNSDSLEPVAAALSLTIKHSSRITRNVSKQAGIVGNEKVIEAAFSPDVFNQATNSPLIEIDAGHVLVLRAREHQASNIKPLEEVKQEIINQLKSMKSEELANKVANEIVQSSQSNQESKEVLAQKYHLNWEKRNNMSRNDKTFDSVVIDQLFHLELGKPVQGQPLPTASFALPSGDSIVIVLTGVHQGNVSSSTQKQSYQTQLQNNFGQQDYQRYVDELFKRAKIKIYEK